MSRTPLVSVVMNVRNGQKYLEEAIRSILDQSYRHFEFIIVNDGSTDNTQPILDRLRVEDSRVLVIHQEPSGIYPSANRGCHVAKGKYIARFDADDISFPERLERQVQFLERSPQVAVLGTAVIRINERGDPIETYTLPTEPSRIKEAMTYWDPIVQPSAMIRKEYFLQVNGYREVFQLAGDYDLWMRISERFELANLAEPLLYWRLHSEEVSNCDVRKHTVYTLLAQESARKRKMSGYDPLDKVESVTPQLLKELGISERRTQKEFFRACFVRINSMLDVRNKLAALNYFEQIQACSSTSGRRKRAAKKMAELYVRAYPENGKAVRNIIIFLWAGLVRFFYVCLLLQIKLSLFAHNRNLRRQSPFAELGDIMLSGGENGRRVPGEPPR